MILTHRLHLWPEARVDSGRALRRLALYSSEFDRVWSRWLNSHLSNR